MPVCWSDQTDKSHSDGRARGLKSFASLLIWLPGLVRSAGHELGLAGLHWAQPRRRWPEAGGRQSEGSTGSGHGGLIAGATDAATLSKADPSHTASSSVQLCRHLPWLLVCCPGPVLGCRDTGLNKKRSMNLSSS